MTRSNPVRPDAVVHRVGTLLRARLSLLHDKAEDRDIDRDLRAAVDLRGTNLWVLVFAVFIASIGLNVNSTAVIIGAMLVSPLMGPIMGIGYGAGIDDFALIRASLKNLFIAALFSLLTSTLYFALSPLHVAQPELLARTSPTIWDVLIALFGGLAGIVGATRKEKSSTIIPGVAIATALMPPLCTAGFGAASADWRFCLSALYLFAINCVFIALSSAIVIKAFRLPRKHFVDERAARRVHRYLWAVVIATIIPSVYLAYELVAQEVFRSRAAEFIHQRLEFPRTHVAGLTVDAKSRRIEVTLVGDTISPADLSRLADQLPASGLKGAELKVYQDGRPALDVAALKTSLLGDLFKGSEATLAERDRTIDQLRAELAKASADRQRFADVPAELGALYPQIHSVWLSEAPEWTAKAGWGTTGVVTMTMQTSRRFTASERARIEQWLKARLKEKEVRLEVEVSATGRAHAGG